MGSVKGTLALPQCHGLFANRHNIALGAFRRFPTVCPTPLAQSTSPRGCALNTNDERRPGAGPEKAASSPLVQRSQRCSQDSKRQPKRQEQQMYDGSTVSQRRLFSSLTSEMEMVWAPAENTAWMKISFVKTSKSYASRPSVAPELVTYADPSCPFGNNGSRGNGHLVTTLSSKPLPV